MRISNQMLTQFVTNATNSAKEGFFKSMMHLNGNRRVLRPADDPIAAKRIIEQNELLGRLDTLTRNQKVVRQDLVSADLTLRNAVDLVQEALELAVQMSNDTFKASDRAAAAQRVTDIREEILKLSNKKQANGHFLFGGVAEDVPAYDPVTGAFVGSALDRKVEVSPGYFVEATINGADSFGDPEQIFTTLQNFANDLTANNLPGVQAAIDGLNTANDQFAIALAGIGSREMALTRAEIQVDELTLYADLRRGELRDVDIPGEVSRLKAAEAALQASIDTGQQLMQMGLLNWR
jgi:flagellar hook-associated protein 3 FlgL